MKTILYNPIFINPLAYYVFPRLTRYLQPDNESTAEPANYIGTIEVKVIAYGDTTLKRTYTNTDSIYLSEFKNTWIRISLFTKVGSCVLGEWKIGNMESDLPYIDPEVLASLKAVVIVGNKTNNDSDRAIVKNLVDASNPFVISNASYNLNSGYGKYIFDFTRWGLTKPPTTCIKKNDSFNITYVGRPVSEGECIVETGNNSDSDIQVYFKVEISGIEDDMEGWFNTANFRNRQQLYNGINIINVTVNSKHWYGFDFIRTDGTALGNCNIVVKQIPEFQGAFVTDGVNDTIISTKTAAEMGITDEVTVVSMIHQIDLNSTYTIATTNYIENSNSREHVRSDVYNYGKTGIYGYSASLINNTKSDIKNILGDEADYYVKSTNSLQTIFDAKFSVVGRISELTEASQVAWYWTIIANKVLTTDQINQVIAYFNLDRTLKPDILCDVKKQGITNENHAEFGDKLIDFSGNGRDIQLNNIAWKGDSGIGKYETELSNTSIWTQSKETTSSPFSSSYNGLSGWIVFANTALTNSADMPSFKIQVKGLLEGQELIYRYYDSNGQSNVYSITKDGEYTLPSDVRTAKPQTSNTSGFQVVKDETNIITITQIPSHAGGLYLDGINDFGKVTGMPIYKDYTFIIEREFLNKTFPNQVCLVSKSKVASEIENGGAFIVDNISVNSIINPYSFYKTTSLPGLNTFDRQIVFQSKYKYLDKDIAAGTATDSDTLWLGTFRDNDSRFANIAIYSLMSFPYSMSEFLIERQLKKYKLGSLYPNMVEFRPVIKANANYNIFYTALLPLTGIVWEKINIGDYIPVGRRVAIQLSFDNEASELVSAISSQLGNISITKNSNNKGYTIFGDILKNKSPQKINITIDEYIRYEDIVQPYPVLLRFNDENGNEVSWGGKFRIGSTITRIGSAADSNLLPNIYNIFGLLLNDNQVTSSKVIVEKTMVFKAKSAYIFDNNEPNCILSPRLLRIPNSSYKILGYIPDISGHGNHGVIHNSAYAEGSGVNEDGSYQFDGVDDFVTIPTVTGGGKQVLMKVNNNTINSMLYDQRSSYASPNSLNSDFAIYNTNTVDNNLIAYQSRLVGKTYIDGILNTNITCEDLLGVLHNITITCDIVVPNNGVVPNIGRGGVLKDLYSNMALYDFMLFDNISTDDKIKQLNEYVGIEAKVELPPYYWDAYGKTNLDVDRGIVPQLGIAKDYSFASFDNEMAWYLINDNYINVVSRNGYEITLKNLSTGVNGWRFQNSTVKGFISHDIPFRIKANKFIRVYWDMHSYKVSTGAEFGEVISITNVSPNKDTYINLRHLTEEELAKLDTNKDRMYYLLWFDLSTIAVNEEVVIEMLPVEGGRNLWLNNYNFAYDKMSGFGGYSLGRFDKSWASSSSNNTSVIVVSRNPYDITLKKLGGNSDWEFNNTELKVISNPVSVKFKSNKNIRVTCDYHYYPVGGNSEGTPLRITSKDLIANKDAIITISPISQENIDKYNIDVNRGYYLIYFQLSSTLAVNEEVTIEMLPLYPNGLVYDGVTDYSENTNIPAFTDFTYILKRQILKGIANSAVMYKGNITVNQGGAFICNYCEPSDTNLFTDFSFGGLLRSNDIDKPIIYGTKTSVNGDSITPGENIDTVGINVGKWVNYLPMVFYKLILYPKTIPLLQINFLKNLMERDEIIDLDNKIFIQE